MITHLSIQGLAIINSLSIEFSPGFNIITGETGAGKSILIRALNFLLGAKTGSESVRQGCDHASVSGEFSVSSEHPALVLLENLGIAVDEVEGRFALLIRRQITSKGRSQSWINDVSVTSQSLRELGLTLVDVFGQHENQRLMDAQNHLLYLDQFLEEDARGRVERLHRECSRIIRELEATLLAFHSRNRSQDYLAFRLEELRAFEPSEENFNSLHEFCQRADGQVHERDLLTRALSCLDGGENGGGVSKSLWEVAKLLGQLPSTSSNTLAPLKEQCTELASKVDDLSFELGKQAESLDVDEKELEEAQSRLFAYQDLYRKLSVKDIAGLIAENERLEGELKSLESVSDNIQTLLKQLSNTSAELASAARDLSRARAKAGKTVKTLVQNELQELAMPGSTFEVEFTPFRRSIPELDFGALDPTFVQTCKTIFERLNEISDSGAERGQFLLASNPGEALLPLTRIASGGEISRIMLALKKALVADAETCVLVFDEIDSGISGRVADVVGAKMHDLASSFQVICISHLPQVAVYADSHFLVQKAKAAGVNRTESTIVRLSKEESAKEIARLLSGAEVSKMSLANALSLIEKARGRKPKLERGHLPRKIKTSPKVPRREVESSL